MANVSRSLVACDRQIDAQPPGASGLSVHPGTLAQRVCDLHLLSNAFTLASPIGDFSQSVDPLECGSVLQACDSRRNEHATGRMLSRALLLRLGGSPTVVTRGDGGEPQWPSGFTGSITHSKSIALVTLARRKHYVGLGVDIEEHGRLELSLVTRILTERECKVYGSIDPTLIFCAKESIYKLLYPFLRRYVDFHEVELYLDRGQPLRPHQGTFRFQFVASNSYALALESAVGYYHMYQGHWLCVAALQNH